MNTKEMLPAIRPLLLAIENHELVLPTMPEHVLKIQRMLDDINVSAGQIVSALSADPAFSVQLIQRSNSAIHSGKPKVDTVGAAVSRLGFKMLRNLITKSTMEKLSNAHHPVIRKHMASFMEHSQSVASISYVLARAQKHLNADQAMLAGLVHDIGLLPLCMYADKNIAVVDEQIFDSVIKQHRGKIGEKLLMLWAFPEVLIEVPIAHEDLRREPSNSHSSYADIVTVANLISQTNAKFVAWDNVTAIKRLGLSPEVCREFHDRFGKEVEAVKELFFDH